MFFLLLLGKHVHKQFALHSIFNKNTIKLGYNCMPSLGKLLKKHKILNQDFNIESGKCNCNNGNCLKSNMIYKATSKFENCQDEIYMD